MPLHCGGRVVVDAWWWTRGGGRGGGQRRRRRTNIGGLTRRCPDAPPSRRQGHKEMPVVGDKAALTLACEASTIGDLNPKLGATLQLSS